MSNSTPQSNPTHPDPSLPLAGLRIIDFTVVFAGPYGTMQLADWGAEVIRVESTTHFASTTRGMLARPALATVQAQTGMGMGMPDSVPGERPWNRSAVFNAHGRNKLSMTVNLRTEEGQEALERLVAVSDGLVENNLPQRPFIRPDPRQVGLVGMVQRNRLGLGTHLHHRAAFLNDVVQVERFLMKFVPPGLDS